MLTLGCTSIAAVDRDKLRDAETASSNGGQGGEGADSGCGSGECASRPSCEEIPEDCGPGSDESCCTSLPVEGGAFHRNYDTVTFTDQSFPADVSAFDLDRYEVTVGRFRKFVAAWDAGWRPPGGAGKHTHLNDGQGLRAAFGGGYETGWDSTWEVEVEPSDENLLGCAAATWTSAAGEGETAPINCVNWYEAYAFCIWDEGFLPSDAEWNCAAAGGDEQRVYAWSDPPTSTGIRCEQATVIINGQPCSDGPLAVGSTSPAGDGRYGQADLTGNVSELVLDTFSISNSALCDDCILGWSSDVLPRGGSFNRGEANVRVSDRAFVAPRDARNDWAGLRCARSPTGS